MPGAATACLHAAATPCLPAAEGRHVVAAPVRANWSSLEVTLGSSRQNLSVVEIMERDWCANKLDTAI